MKVFISHSNKDKEFVRTLKNCLSLNYIETWFDEDQLDFGDSLVAKLEDALDNSSHLIIILSPASIESEWVKFELEKAIQNNRTGLSNKIIPIKLGECKIPESIADLLYADLSNEVILPDGDRIKFISDGFDKFFLKLVRAIKNTANAINKEEKKEIIKSIKSTEKEIREHSISIHRGNYRLIGYTKESREKYQKIIAKHLNNNSEIDEYRPFLLPPSIKQLLNLEIGEKMKFFYDEFFDSSYGQFAGFRDDDIAITLDKRIRDELHLERNQYYQIEIDPKNNLVTFVDNIKVVANN